MSLSNIKSIKLALLMLFVAGSTLAQDDFYSDGDKKKDKKEKIEIDFLNEGAVNKEATPISDDDYATEGDYYQGEYSRQQEEDYNKRMGITDSTTYYTDENGEVKVTNNYYYGDDYDFGNEYYDYEYATRIKRFRRENVNYGYYDDYYTNYSYYDSNPIYYGTSIYSSYGWWHPAATVWNGGWSYYGGWSLGWSWGWGWSGNYGYHGNRYYGYGYNGIYNSHGYYDGYYASNGYYGNNNYYNSYDHNSNYYGKRGGRSSTSGYGGRSSRPGNTVATAKPVKSFGQKYEAAVKNNPRGNGGTTKGNYTNTPRTPVKTNGYTSGTNNPTRNPVKTTTRPKTNTYQPSKSTYTRPKNTYNQTNSRPKSTYTRPKTYTKPSYTKPKSRPSYSKPKTYSKPSYSKPKSRPSYSKPSRGSKSYNRGSSGSRSSGSRSSGSAPRKRN